MAQEVIEVVEREVEVIEILERGLIGMTGPTGPVGPQANINYTVVSSSQTVSNRQMIAANTSGGSFTLTLPSNPAAGDAIDIFDYSDTFDTNPLTIARNGQNIEGLADDLVANVEGAYFTLIFTGGSRGWQVVPRYGVSGLQNVLTTEGDLLYRGASAETRLGIGTAGQILKVNSGATAPEWGNQVNADWDAVSGDAQILNKPATFTPSSHTHGNITNDGKIGATSGLPVVTTTDGAVTTLALGTANQVLRVNSGATGVEFGAGFDAASPPAIGSTTPNSGAFTTLSANNGTLTASAPVLDLAQTWNNAAVAFTALRVNVTNTNSLPSSKLLDVQSGGSSDFSVYGSRRVTLGAFSPTFLGPSLELSSGTGFYDSGGLRVTVAGTNSLIFTNAGMKVRGGTLGFQSGDETVLVSDGNDILAMRRGANPNTFRLYTTYASTTSFERLSLRGQTTNNFIIATEKGTTGGAARGLELQTDSVTRLTLGDAGGVTINSGNLVLTDNTGSETATFDAQSKLTANRTYDLPDASGVIALTSDIPSGGSKTYAVFAATDNQPPASNYATLDTRNSIAVLDFDDATDESAVFVSIIPEGASLGSGLKIRLHWMATTATSGDVVWDVSLERMTTDLDSDSFDTIASGTAAANGTSGILTVTEITLTTIDSVTAGDGYRLKVTRDANNASDTMTGDAELVVCEVRSAA